MPMKEDGGYCRQCGQNVMIRRSVPNHLVHALATLFLCGFWLPVWLVVTLMNDSTWRCTRCGAPARLV